MEPHLNQGKLGKLYDVIIVGGGPVGLFLGLNLARDGIETLVLEAEADIVPSPRALMYVWRRFNNSLFRNRVLTKPGTIPLCFMSSRSWEYWMKL
jgi:flavin-dependent dehydrogenase